MASQENLTWFELIIAARNREENHPKAHACPTVTRDNFPTVRPYENLSPILSAECDSRHIVPKVVVNPEGFTAAVEQELVASRETDDGTTLFTNEATKLPVDVWPELIADPRLFDC